MPRADQEQRAAYLREWRKKNPEASRAIHKRWRDKIRFEVLVAYGGDPPTCACCGEDRLPFLTLDHMNGGGNEDRRARGHRGSGPAFYTDLKKKGWPEGFRVLCWNCNAAIGILGECPHVTEQAHTPSLSE